ncbi:unnamed protein product [Arctogadus glacialis]
MRRRTQEEQPENRGTGAEQRWSEQNSQLKPSLSFSAGPTLCGCSADVPLRTQKSPEGGWTGEDVVYWALSKMPIEGTISGDRSPTLLGLLSDTSDASVLVLDEARFTKEKRCFLSRSSPPVRSGQTSLSLVSNTAKDELTCVIITQVLKQVF